jgi:hypothetical protein
MYVLMRGAHYVFAVSLSMRAQGGSPYVYDDDVGRVQKFVFALSPTASGGERAFIYRCMYLQLSMLESVGELVDKTLSPPP